MFVQATASSQGETAQGDRCGQTVWAIGAGETAPGECERQVE